MTVAVRRFNSADELVAAVINEVTACDLATGVALTGGRIGTSVSLALCDALAQRGAQGVPLWFSDERYLPGGDEQRNDTAVLSHVGAGHHVMVESVKGPDASASAQESAIEYESRLLSHGLPKVAILSIGPDGHVASIFPGHELFDVTTSGVCAITDSPKPPPTRVTWTLPLLAQCPSVFLLAAGPDKQEIVQRVLAGDASLPATTVATSAVGLFVA